ncbi:hypothetical protein K402DRAFT_27233 [Aulographum hederae CBS 113979]|uniref:Uncharacterized protein n=1 Tax=Aulographum hederae CBS 113979 TaxID=1176131 RepID=A0A6G1H6B9_9PEZI|nr:hypothetical protein K402DRAFT_27233 [Aulographum hederae CBS 113979]
MKGRRPGTGRRPVQQEWPSSHPRVKTYLLQAHTHLCRQSAVNGNRLPLATCHHNRQHMYDLSPLHTMLRCSPSFPMRLVQSGAPAFASSNLHNVDNVGQGWHSGHPSALFLCLDINPSRPVARLVSHIQPLLSAEKRALRSSIPAFPSTL